MKLSDAAVDRPKVVIVLTIMTLLLAVMSAYLIPVQRTPAIHTAIVMISIPYPGAEPTEVEDEITAKIEEALERLDKVDFISSTSLRGSSVVQIVFLDGVDGKRARDDVEHLVNEVRRQLPMGREVQPIVTDLDFESFPLMLVTLTGPQGYDERALKQTAEDVQDMLEGIPGVANTQLFGGREREIHVDVDPQLLSQYGLSIGDVRRTLEGFHARMPGGVLDSESLDLHVRSETKFRDVHDIREAVIKQVDGRLITVSDVAAVDDTYRRLMSFSQLDGNTSATIIVNKESGINTLATAKVVKQRIEQIAGTLPHIKISTSRDISEDISVMFETLGSDAVFGAWVVFLIMALSMGVRLALIVVLAIPFAGAVSLVFLYMAGYAVSNMVIFSYIVAGGMVIDGAIIVSDAIYRYLEQGYDSKTAAKLGTHEVAMPVFAADLVTVAAFAPMMLVPGIMGDFMGVLPVVVCLSLAGSLIVDHFLVPVVASIWFRNYKAKTPQQEQAGGKTGYAVGGLWAPFYRGYEAMLRWSLRNRWAVVTCCGMSIAWAGMMLYFGLIGYTFFPGSDRGQFEISFEMPLGASIEETAAAAKSIYGPLEDLRQRGELRNYVTAVGSSQALAARLDTDPTMGPEFGKVMVELVPPAERSRKEDEIVNWLRDTIVPPPGMTFKIEQVEEGPPGGYDVALRLSGKNLDQLGTLGRALYKRLAQIEGTVDARCDYRAENPTLVIEPRPSVVGMFDMTEADVARSIQTVVLGDTTIELRLDDEDVTLRLQALPKYQRFGRDVADLMLVSPTGKRATVGELADLRIENGLYSVNRRDLDRAVTVMANVRDDLGVIPDHVFKQLREQVLPEFGLQLAAGSRVSFIGQPNTPAEGIRASFTGENEERDKGAFWLFNSMILGVVLIFGILVIQFYSFRQSIVVMSTVPLSFVGVVVGMLVCQFDFSLAAFIGLVSLTGVVVNDAIVLVDFVNEAIKRGLPLDEAVVEGGMKRCRAVILTMLTSNGGMLPTFFNFSGGSEFWQPLCGSIIFGLLVSAFLTLIVIPVGYSLAYDPFGTRRRREAGLVPAGLTPGLPSPAPDLLPAGAYRTAPQAT
ncbi:MAG: efflux RND transporter permease subunit [Pirellulales bacterium]|nr:efflux RND transporter permease subunit [Pirellulales bacterium]